jgi:hypothetical protein
MMRPALMGRLGPQAQMNHSGPSAWTGVFLVRTNESLAASKKAS